MVFKSSKNSDAVMIPDHDIEALQWLHAARGYELKVVHHKGSITKFDGFKESVSYIISLELILYYLW